MGFYHQPRQIKWSSTAVVVHKLKCAIAPREHTIVQLLYRLRNDHSIKWTIDNLPCGSMLFLCLHLASHLRHHHHLKSATTLRIN